MELKEKLHKTLRLLLHPQNYVRDDTALESLFTHLSTDHYTLLEVDFMVGWIAELLKTVPSPRIFSFALRLLAVHSRDESRFLLLHQQQVIDNVVHVAQTAESLQTPTVKLALVRLIREAATHDAGLAWIKETKIWRLCLDFEDQARTIYIVRETADLVLHVLERRIDDETFVLEVLEEMLAPILHRIWIKSDDMSVEVDDARTKAIMTKCLGFLEEFFLKVIQAQRPSRVSYYILVRYGIENKIWHAKDVSVGLDFMMIMMRLFHHANIVRLALLEIPAADTTTEPISFRKFTINFYNFVNVCATHYAPHIVVHLCELHTQLWHKLGAQQPSELMLPDQEVTFSDQVLMMKIMPIITCVYQEVNMHGTQKEYIRAFWRKIYTKSCEFTVRHLYLMRDTMERSGQSIVNMAVKAINGLASSKSIMDRERAVYILQAFTLLLMEFVPSVKQKEDAKDDEELTKCEKRQKDLIGNIPTVLSALLNGTKDLFKAYKFTWTDCLKSPTIGELTLALLNDNVGLDSRIAVQTLQLCQTAIEHFLSPNMALLIDNMTGSGLENLASTILKRLHDTEWEVRDSTLELLLSVVEISKNMFPPLQEMISTQSLCSTVVAMAKSDTESYVRVSALRCLAAMFRLKDLWNNHLATLNLLPLLLDLLEVETEGLVRREAVVTLTAFLTVQKMPVEQRDRVFSTLAYCAVKELHWEVKLAALEYWRLALEQEFYDQGMIGGVFPASTFSKEKRKIVQLTPAEIERRIGRALEEFAAYGGLGVLLACLNDEDDVSVTRSAIEVVDTLLDRLAKYDFLQKRAKRARTDEVAMDVAAATNHADADELGAIEVDDRVIAAIADADDIELLAKAYRGLRMDGETGDAEVRIDRQLYKRFAAVSAEQFLEVVTTANLKKVQEAREEWIVNSQNSIDSLLDDIIAALPESDVNLMDCY